MTRAFRFVLLLAALAMPVSAKVLVVSEITADNQYTQNLGVRGDQMNLRMLRAVQQILGRYNADYRVLSPNVAKTEFCRTGIVSYNFNGTSGSSTEAFDAVIHVGYNSLATSTFTGYRPDSLTLTAKLPIVPQLFLADFDLYPLIQTSSADSCWTNNLQTPGSGTGNHEGEGSLYNTLGGAERFFDTIYGGFLIKKSGNPTGGMRVLLAGGANATMTNMELTGNMASNVDSLSTANTDTMKVYEKLNLHKYYGALSTIPASRIVIATASAGQFADSAQSAGAGTTDAYHNQAINWPVLLFSMAHLDSLTGGLVLGKKKVVKWGAVVLGGGMTSDRRHPGGFFLPDSSIVGVSCDTLKLHGARMVVACDPESLATRPSHVGLWKRIGGVRFTPWVMGGIDTLTLPASGSGSATRPVDVFGRYRMRAIYGDFSAAGADSSVWAQLRASKRTLSSLVGGPDYMSATLMPPQGDWSPYQYRGGSQRAFVDTLFSVMDSLGFRCLLSNVITRDSDPNYLRSNPIGWLHYEQPLGTVSRKVTLLGYTPYSAVGSRVGSQTDGLSFYSVLADSIPPFCSPGPCNGASFPVFEENRFWNSLFGPSPQSYDSFNDPDASFQPGMSGNASTLYNGARASVYLMSAQSLGGQSPAAPSRPGMWTMKHLLDATSTINRAAGRVIIQNAYPEDIEP